jgi:hypothetical protein
MNPYKNIDLFPLSELPLILRNAIVEVQSHTMAPQPLVVNSALSVLSLACQDTYDVELPYGAKVPVALYLLTIADSGERKTTVDRFFMGPIEAAEKINRENSEKAEAKYEINLAAWNLEFERLKKRIGREKNVDSTSLKIEVANLINRKPEREKFPVLIVKDVTPAALVERLHSTWPSAALVSNEAGALLNGHTSSQLPMLNSLWDGDSLAIDRKTEKTLFLENARLTIAFMIQPKSFENFQSGRGKLARDNGFFSRFLITCPYSTQGSRISNLITTPALDAVQIFNKRVATLLDLVVKRDINDKRSILVFSAEAKASLRDFQNHLEATIHEGGCYFQIRDAVSKTGQHAARLAGLFHVFEGGEGDIQNKTAQSAVRVADWYLKQFAKQFLVQNQMPQHHADALLLDDWFRNRYAKGMPTTVLKNQIRQLGPNAIRDSARLAKALELLINETIIVQHFVPNSRALWIEFFPQTYPLAQRLMSV